MVQEYLSAIDYIENCLWFIAGGVISGIGVWDVSTAYYYKKSIKDNLEEIKENPSKIDEINKEYIGGPLTSSLQFYQSKKIKREYG